MLFQNYYYLALATLSKKVGRGKYYRKKLFSTRRILDKNFPENSEFSFLQVGANDGVSFDFLYGFVTKRDAIGVVIEPIKEYFDELCENYKSQSKIIKINKAVHKSDLSAILYKIDSREVYLYPDWVKGLASFDISNFTKFDFIKREHILEEGVKAGHLMNMAAESGIGHFDYFQIDTEGYDYEVIDMFDFSKYKPKMVKAEFVNLTGEGKKKMRGKLRDNGYYAFCQGLDIVGIDLKNIRL